MALQRWIMKLVLTVASLACHLLQWTKIQLVFNIVQTVASQAWHMLLWPKIQIVLNIVQTVASQAWHMLLWPKIQLVLNIVQTVASQAWHMLQRPKKQLTPPPHDSLRVDASSLLTIVEDILRNASTHTALVDPKTNNEVLIDKDHQQGISEVLAYTIHKIGCEMSCNCSGEGDVKAITVAVLNTLTKYSWDAKVVLVLSAFAVHYGEFCLISQLHATHPIAKSVVLLKPLPDISERESLISSLLKVVIDVTKCIIQLMELPSKYHDKLPLSDAITHIPNAVYLAIRIIVACASQSIGLINIGHEYLIEAQEKLSVLTDKLTLCRKHIDQVSNKSYNNLKRLIESTHKDNMEILTALIHTNDSQPLYNDSNKKVSLDVLRDKTVMLFISCFDISDEEIEDIVQISGKAERQYEVVWLPIIDESVESTQIIKEIERKASLMSWYSLHHSLQPEIIRYIKEVWHFEKQPLLVVFNPQGKIVCTNAYHMMMIWGSKAFPFDTQRGVTLWEEATWSLDILADEIDSNIEQWVEEGRFICLYGGGDINWIKKFTTAMQEVAGVGITVEIIYVGKKYIETITKENLSKCLDDPPKIRRFRARLESMWYSKMQHGRSIKNDSIMKDLMMLLSSDGSGQGWTMIGHGLKEMITVNGKIIMDCLLNIKESKVNITSENFISTLNNEIKEVKSITYSGDPAHGKHCNHLILPNTAGVIQKNVICVDCNRSMKKYIMYKCCIE